MARRSANVLNEKEHPKIPCVTDLNLRDERSRTLISQSLSPPRCLRLVESEAAEYLRYDVERGLCEEELRDRFLNGRDEPTAPHIKVPGRPPSETPVTQCGGISRCLSLLFFVMDVGRPSR